MDEALIGLAGIVIGTLLGGTGRYFTLRRDAWREARASGLLLLGDVRAVLAAGRPDSRVAVETALATRTWTAHQRVLAAFRRGRYPNGLRAPQWLRLAACFAALRELAGRQDDASWSRARAELETAHDVLKDFADDPAVLPYVLSLGLIRRTPRSG